MALIRGTVTEKYEMTWDVRKSTFQHVRPAKIQISLCFDTVWHEFSLRIFWIVKDVKFLHVNNEDSNQTAYMQADSSLCCVHMSEGMFS